MNTQLFARAIGIIGPEALQRAELGRRLYAVQPAPEVHFDGRDRQLITRDDSQDRIASAHQAGVNSISVDHFEGR